MKSLPAALASVGVIALIAGAATLYWPQAARGSDHQDTPLASMRAGADTTDLFVFPAADPKNVVLVLDIHALIPRTMGSLFDFDPGVMYQFKIATDGGPRENKVIQFRAVGIGAAQRIEMYGPAAPAMVGTESTWVGSPQSFAVGDGAKLANGVEVFAGPRKDPFFFDLSQFLKIVPDRFGAYHDDPGAKVPPPSDKCFRKVGLDFFADYDVLAFVVEFRGWPQRLLHSRSSSSCEAGPFGLWPFWAPVGFLEVVEGGGDLAGGAGVVYQERDVGPL